MTIGSKLFRPHEFKPHPQDAGAVELLAPTRPRFQLNPRGQVWHFGTGEKFRSENIRMLQGLPNLISVSIGNAIRPMENLSDDDVRQLCELPKLQALVLDSCTRITDESFDPISANHRIRWLCLNCPNLSDRGMERVAKMTPLLKLGLMGSAVTERSVPHLQKLVNLRRLILTDCKFSPDAMSQLRKSLPNCNVVA